MGAKKKIQNSLTLTQIYQYYKKDLDTESKYNIEYKTFRAICKEYNQIMMSLIIDQGYFFKLPYKLGLIRIKKNKPNLNKTKLKPDFGLYIKSEGKFKNKHLNEHTGGYYCRFYWSKINALIVNKGPYSFIPTRQNKRYMAKLLKEGGITQVNKYFE